MSENPSYVVDLTQLKRRCSTSHQIFLALKKNKIPGLREHLDELIEQYQQKTKSTFKINLEEIIELLDRGTMPDHLVDIDPITVGDYVSDLIANLHRNIWFEAESDDPDATYQLGSGSPDLTTEMTQTWRLEYVIHPDNRFGPMERISEREFSSVYFFFLMDMLNKLRKAVPEVETLKALNKDSLN